MALAQAPRGTDVMQHPFQVMVIFQVLILATTGFHGDPFLHTLAIYAAFDLCCVGLHLVHTLRRGERPILSRMTKILIMASPLVLLWVAVLVQEYLL